MPAETPPIEQTDLSQTLRAYQLALNEAAIVSITDTSGRIVYVNDKFVEISQYTPNELIGKSHRIVNSGYHPGSFFQEMWQTIASGKNWRGEIRNKAKDGSFYWVDTVIAPVLDKEGHIFQYLSIRNLITVQKENEVKLVRMQQELKKRNQLFNDSQLIAKVGSWYLDISSNFLEWSDETYNIFEVLPGTVISYESFLQTVHPADRTRVEEAWHEALKNGKYEIEHRIVTKSGDKWVKEWARFKLDDQLRPVSALGTVQDITEKKKAEHELIDSKRIIEESEQKFRAITNQATEGIALADVEGNYQFVNPALCAMTGYTEEELLGMTVFDLTARSQPHSIFFESKGEKERLPVEVNLRRKDGSEFMTEIIGTNIQIAGQQLVLGSVRDISERKIAENKLLASEIRYRRLFEAAKDGILILDAETGLIEDVNPFLVSVLRCSQQELIGKRFWEIGIFKDIAANEHSFAQFRKEEYLRYENLLFETKEGHPVWVEFVSNNYKVNEKQVIQCNIRDITARKQAEEKLVNSEAQYKDLVENITDLICTHDLDGNILSMNAAAEKAIGIRFDPSRQMNIKDILVRKFRKDFDLYIAGILQSGRIQGIMQVQTRSGELRLWEFNNSLNTSGKVPVVRGYARDITERKKAEAALKAAQERMAKIVSNVPVGILLHGHDSEIIFSNESARDMLGLTADQLLGKSSLDPIWNVVHEDGSSFPGPDHPVPQAVARKKAIKNVTMGVYRPRTDDIVWLLVNAIPELDAAGNVKNVICTFSDISDLRKAGEELRKNQARFQVMVENIAGIIWLVDENLRVIYRSPSSERVSGWSTEEINARGILSFAHPDDREKAKAISEEIYQRPGILLPVSVRVIHKNGHYLSLEGTAINLLHHKHIKAVVVNVHDVTERNKTEQQLIESENRLRTIVQTEPECVKILNRKGELLSINPAGLAMVEADCEEQVQGYPMLELVNPRYRTAFRQLSDKVIKGASGKLEFEITGFKGTQRWVETHAVPLRDSEGRIISILGVTRDITERKKVEQEIRKTTEDLRQLAAHLQSIREEERKRIGREIHDELGQQLTAIKMDIAWIDKKIATDMTPLKNKLHNVIRLLDESNHSIRRILSELRPSIPGDRDLLESLEWLSRQLTANTGIPVQLTTDQTEIKLPEPVSTCIFRVCQEAFTNITRHAGASNVGTSLSMHDAWITLTIEDDGKGFDPEAAQSKKSFGILGMKERVLSLGGRFELVSSPGAGTRITISLPLFANQ